MPADIETSAWSETAASNIQPSPDGWPPNSSPNIVYTTDRETMGAIKRDWNRRNPTTSTGGSANAQTLTYTVAPTAYVTGQRFCFFPSIANTGATTLNVNGLGAKNVVIAGVVCTGGELKVGQPIEVVYDGSQFQILSGSNGTVTGYLTVNSGLATINGPTSGNATLILNKAQGVTGQLNNIFGDTAGVARWAVSLGDNAAESGSPADTGSNFSVYRYHDTGVAIDTPLSIARLTGVATFSQAIVNGPSDRSLKENVTPLDGALDKVKALQGVSFNMKATPEKREIGLVAQDVEAIVPEIIQQFTMTDRDGKQDSKLALDYPKLTALLIEAVKTLTARIEKLEARLPLAPETA